MRKVSVPRSRHRKRQKRIQAVTGICVVLVLAGFSAFVCYPKSRQMGEVSGRYDRLQMERVELLKRKRDLLMKLWRLENDKDAIDEAARRELDMALPGETTYQLVPEEKVPKAEKGGGDSR